MVQLYIGLTSSTLLTSILVLEFSCSYQCLKKGLLSKFSYTVQYCRFRSQSELDRYLKASQIRERAIERTNNVVGTYGPFCLYLIFSFLFFSLIMLQCHVFS